MCISVTTYSYKNSYISVLFSPVKPTETIKAFQYIKIKSTFYHVITQKGFINLLLTFSQRHHVVRLLAGSTPSHCIHGNHPETVHGKGEQPRHLVACFVTVSFYSVVHSPVTVLANSVRQQHTGVYSMLHNLMAMIKNTSVRLHLKAFNDGWLSQPENLYIFKTSFRGQMECFPGHFLQSLYIFKTTSRDRSLSPSSG